MKKIVLLFLVNILCVGFICAQDVIYLNNGNVVKGKVINDKDEITIQMPSGETLSYKKTEVRDIQIGKTQVTVPETPQRPKYVDYSSNDKGWWCAAESWATGSFYRTSKNLWGISLNFINGYRFSEYLKVGVGVGVRGYFTNDELFRKEILEKRQKRAMICAPIFVDARGNFMTQQTRMCVPFWNASVGYAILDQFFYTAGLGIRVGQKRNDFVFSINYQGQLLPYDNTYVNGISFRIGYEF